MSSARRTRPRDVAVLGLAVGVFGISFGVLSVAAGVSPALTCAMSLLVFAGGAQFATIGVIGAGGSPAAAVASGLLLNARYAAFGIALAPITGVGGVARRLLAAHLTIDESAALALAEPDPRRARRLFWGTGAAIFVLWNAGTALGAFAGSAIGDPAAWGLDAAFPAGFLALLAPLVRDRASRAAALAGAGLAVALLPVAPPGVPVLAAALGALAGLGARLRAQARDGEPAAATATTAEEP
ncbi:MAG TPA: AzlC family ABC transporter permease [Egibacteraceae bacterium]